MCSASGVHQGMSTPKPIFLDGKPHILAADVAEHLGMDREAFREVCRKNPDLSSECRVVHGGQMLALRSQLPLSMLSAPAVALLTERGFQIALTLCRSPDQPAPVPGTHPVVQIDVALPGSTLDFEGQPVALVTYQGRPSVPAHCIGTLLGYRDAGKNLMQVVRKSWAQEFIAGTHYDVLSGSSLASYKRQMATLQPGAVSPATKSLSILYPKGIDLVAQKTEKPVGDRLRAFLSGKLSPILRSTCLPGDLPPTRPEQLPLDFSPARTPTKLKAPTQDSPWWWGDIHRYLVRCIATGFLTELEAVRTLAPIYSEFCGVQIGH